MQKAHTKAAEHHGKSDHVKGKEHSAQAQQEFKIAHEHSETAHGKSAASGELPSSIHCIAGFVGGSASHLLFALWGPYRAAGASSNVKSCRAAFTSRWAES